MSQTILGQVLFALWDSGFYEYTRARASFGAAEAAAALGYEPAVFAVLVDYLCGRGLLERSAPERLRVTEHGAELSNCLSRGFLTLYLGGYRSDLDEPRESFLRGEIGLADPRLDRSTAHVALGTENITCSHIIPAVIAHLVERDAHAIVDLGCGAGGFLIQWARLRPERRGIGIDVSEAVLEPARRHAAKFGVGDRLRFIRGAVGPTPLPLDPATFAGTQAVTAMFMLHEFGRDGREAIVSVVEALRRSFPGRLLLFTEAPPTRAPGLEAGDATHLDYAFIHPLSRQGSPMAPADWQGIVEAAGCKEFACDLLGGLVYLYTVRL